MKTAAVITYSSYHKVFIKRCVEEIKKVTDNVVVVAYDHFFDGVEEPSDLEDTLLELDVHFAILPWQGGQPSRHYHNSARAAGYHLLMTQNVEFNSLFFIDADEVVDGVLVKEWLENKAEVGEDYKLAHKWYYRDTCYAADQVEEGAVLVSKETLQSPETEWFGPRERENYSRKWNYMTGYKHQVLGHHYSWAGTKEMLLRKVQSWGHNQDNVNWEQMVNEEFTHEFQGCPFRPNYTFKKVEPFIGFTLNEDRS